VTISYKVQLSHLFSHFTLVPSRLPWYSCYYGNRWGIWKSDSSWLSRWRLWVIYI